MLPQNETQGLISQQESGQYNSREKKNSIGGMKHERFDNQCRRRTKLNANYCMLILSTLLLSTNVQAFQPNPLSTLHKHMHNYNINSQFAKSSLNKKKLSDLRWNYMPNNRNMNVLKHGISNKDEAITASQDVATTSTSSDDDVTDRIYQTAFTRTALSVAASTLFGVSIWYWMGQEAAEEFFAGYIVEQSLSVDNLFVFLLLFDYFQVPMQYQNRVLNYGIVGAVVMRAIVIALGSAVLHQFKPVLLVFASILLFSSFTALSQLGKEEEDEEDMADNAIVKFSRSLFPTTDLYDGDRFFTDLEGGESKATPLLLCLVAVEISDVVFAVDSIPAVFGVTEDSFIVFTSNMFAILGLRSLYTVLSKAAADLEYLEPAVAVVLGFIGSKMIAEYFGYLIPTSVALIVVASVLSVGIAVSLLDLDSKSEDNDDVDCSSDDVLNE